MAQDKSVMGRRFITFEQERIMSLWENRVEYNISESGVHPLTVTKLVEDPSFVEELLTTGLTYPQSNGIDKLREHIAALYPGANSNNVLVTTGCAQANYTAILTLMEPGDEIVIMLPNYLQIWGIAHNLGLNVKSFHLKEELRWFIDLDELEDAVTDNTRLIAVVNPNNPTGHILTGDEMDAIAAAADRVGAWLLADEVYAGAERVTDKFTPSFWGRTEKVLAMNSLSKAYGLPGLRIGWVVAPEEIIAEIWARQDYITIGTTMLGNKLAAYALSPEIRPRIIARTRKYIRDGYGNLEAWLEENEGTFTLIPPQAAAIAFPRYHREINSTELVKLFIEKSVFCVPGDNFGLDHFIRISFGLPADYLNEGLRRLQQVLMKVG